MVALGVLRECWIQILATVLATLSALSNGIAYGWTAPMLPYFLSNATHIPMDRHQVEQIEVIFLFGGICGLPMSIFMVNRFGRRTAILVSTFGMAVCWLMILFTYNLYVIYAARMMCGMSGNMVFIGAPMYIAEIAEPRIRGLLSASIYTMMLIGFVVVYTVGPFTPFFVCPLIGACVGALELFTFPFMPESPYFYVYKNRLDDAHKSLTRLRSSRANIDKEIEEIKIGIERQKSERGRLQDMFLIRSNRYALFIMFVLNTGEHFVGISVIYMNIHSILQEADSTYLSPAATGILFSVVMLVAATAASMHMDRFGRKSLLIASATLTGIALLIMTIYFHLKNAGHDVRGISWIPVVCVMSYAATFKLGMGIVPIVVTAEIFSAKVKALGMTIADLFYCIPAISSIKIYSILVENYGIHVPFYWFTASSFLVAILVYFLLPETKGKTLEEIQLMLKGRRKGGDADKDKHASAILVPHTC